MCRAMFRTQCACCREKSITLSLILWYQDYYAVPKPVCHSGLFTCHLLYSDIFFWLQTFFILYKEQSLENLSHLFLVIALMDSYSLRRNLHCDFFPLNFGVESRKWEVVTAIYEALTDDILSSSQFCLGCFLKGRDILKLFWDIWVENYDIIYRSCNTVLLFY